MTLRGALLEIVISGLIRARLGEAVSQSPSAVFKGRPHGAVKERKKPKKAQTCHKELACTRKRDKARNRSVCLRFFFSVWFGFFRMSKRPQISTSESACMQGPRTTSVCSGAGF